MGFGDSRVRGLAKRGVNKWIGRRGDNAIRRTGELLSVRSASEDSSLECLEKRD